MTRTAVILFNLGGPDSLDSVRPFLFNLFNDPAIIDLPTPLRWLLAQIISRRRAPTARGIYQHLGGRSPLLEGTQDQAVALQRHLDESTAAAETIRVFVAMRYWHPMGDAVAAAVKEFAPDSIVLLPLYPQFSTTTTGSSLDNWRRAAKSAGLDVPTRAVCCYPDDAGLIAAQIKRVRDGLEKARAMGRPRVLFSAHGLPEKIVAKGDPYPWQVEQSARLIVEALAEDDLDWTVCYQSRVGPLQWIGPAIEDELRRAAADRTPVVVVPISFVSEHSETLVELDIEYAEMAKHLGVPGYIRVPAVATAVDFIGGLAALARRAMAAGGGDCGRRDGRLCPQSFGACAHGRALGQEPGRVLAEGYKA